MTYWESMICDNIDDQEACLSWFGPTIPEAWGMPLKADLLEDPETGKTQQLRALFRLPDGTFQQAIRRWNKNGFVIATGAARPAILKGFRP